ncbi:hypothetical protein BDV93DRAFT_564701 [Ceratobasidium sp. AG-I]|nr:hypothetical protein BDV93DRAFT_564701 [Ceratobasidium sp. AG-I]
MLDISRSTDLPPKMMDGVDSSRGFVDGGRRGFVVMLDISRSTDSPPKMIDGVDSSVSDARYIPMHRLTACDGGRCGFVAWILRLVMLDISRSRNLPPKMMDGVDTSCGLIGSPPKMVDGVDSSVSDARYITVYGLTA